MGAIRAKILVHNFKMAKRPDSGDGMTEEIDSNLKHSAGIMAQT